MAFSCSIMLFFRRLHILDLIVIVGGGQKEFEKFDGSDCHKQITVADDACRGDHRIDRSLFVGYRSSVTHLPSRSCFASFRYMLYPARDPPRRN